MRSIALAIYNLAEVFPYHQDLKSRIAQFGRTKNGLGQIVGTRILKNETKIHL
jgi:hypothetical protein